MLKVTYPTYLALKCQNTGTKMDTNCVNKQSNMLLLLFPSYNSMQVTPATFLLFLPIFYTAEDKRA